MRLRACVKKLRWKSRCSKVGLLSGLLGLGRYMYSIHVLITPTTKVTLINTKSSTGLLLNYNRKKKIMVYTLKTRKSKNPNNCPTEKFPSITKRATIPSPPRSPLCLENITIHKNHRERKRDTLVKIMATQRRIFLRTRLSDASFLVFLCVLSMPA